MNKDKQESVRNRESYKNHNNLNIIEQILLEQSLNTEQSILQGQCHSRVSPYCEIINTHQGRRVSALAPEFSQNYKAYG